jgi:uncharacterized protein (TIGR00730 family)
MVAAMPHDRNLEGVWGAIARQVPERGALARALVAELEEGIRLLDSLPPAVTFFGGARVRPDDPFYAAADRMGEILADRRIPPRTGAGPGIMSAVPEGFRRRLAALGEAGDETAPPDATGEPGTGRARMLTQGFNIRLPFEQSVNPAIDVSYELVHFPTRKLTLWEKALGLVIFPGGYGTLDELLEVWRLKQSGRLDMPLVMFGRDFWQPLWHALEEVAAEHRRITIQPEAFRLLEVTDDPEEAIDVIDRARDGSAFPKDLAEAGRRIARDLMDGLDYLERLDAAVTFLGGSRLESGDEALGIAEQVAERLAKEGVPTRAGGPGALSLALARGGHRGAIHLPQQAFGMRREDARNLYGADRVHIVGDRLTHKVLLTENTRAIVALPGGLGTLDEMFSILCQLQTRKIPSRRVILVGRAFWTPLFGAVRAQMLDGPRQTISAADLDLVTITDDPDEAAALCLSPPPDLSPKTGRG